VYPILKITADNISSDIIEGLQNSGMEVVTSTNCMVISSADLDFYPIINYCRQRYQDKRDSNAGANTGGGFSSTNREGGKK